MPYRYYNFIGLPARVEFDGESPETCEVYDPAQIGLLPDNALMMDVLEDHGSWEITQDQFDTMLQRLREAADRDPAQRKT